MAKLAGAPPAPEFLTIVAACFGMTLDITFAFASFSITLIAGFGGSLERIVSFL